MLIDFCRKCLKTDANSSVISNDGYEVTNLTSDSDRGFLAYSCIKPPVHIDFTFICNIEVNHILIWPHVGAQKSSGFEVSVKSGRDFKRVSTAYLSAEHSGVLFYRRDVDRNSFGAPSGFSRRYLQISHDQSLNNVKNMRISILKTENSVPAVGRVEIWGSVSKFNNRETIALAHSLWQNNNLQREKHQEVDDTKTVTKDVSESSGESSKSETGVPDCFLDPITWNIMIQPIVLPSGVTIDQSTLEKHGATEAMWGRSISDPFTGLPFNESRKPIFASALKARIDKYLLDNQDTLEVKALPRLSGHKQIVMSTRNKPLEVQEIISESTIQSSSGQEPIAKSSMTALEKNARSQTLQTKFQHEIRVHKLPIIPMRSKRSVAKSAMKPQRMKTIRLPTIVKEASAVERRDCRESDLNRTVETVLSNLRRFEKEKPVERRKCLENCKCASKVFYKLLCNHVLCRDVLTKTEDSRCPICNSEFKSRDLERVHGQMVNE